MSEEAVPHREAPVPERRPPVPALRVRDCLASFGLALLLPFTGLLVLELTAPGLGDGPVLLLVLGLQWLGLAGWPLWVARRHGGVRAALALDVRSVDLAWGGIGLAVAVVGAGVVVTLQQQVVPVELPTATEALLDVGGGWAVGFVVLFATAGPLAEEIHFRGAWHGALRRRGLPSAVVVVLTAVLFAVVHLEPTRALVLVVPGLVLGWLRERTGRLGAPLVAHCGLNALAGVAALALA